MKHENIFKNKTQFFYNILKKIINSKFENITCKSEFEIIFIIIKIIF